MKRSLPILAIVLAACAGNPQRLPVAVSVCSAIAQPNGFGIAANVQNNADRPISRLDVSSAFYQGFRYQRYTGSVQFKRELDPGQNRDVVFGVDETPAARPHGQAIRCFITHIGYLDGTSQDAPPSQ